MNYLIDGFKNYFNFSGRATRKQYWFYALWVFLISSLCLTIDFLVGTANFFYHGGGLVNSLFSLAALIPGLGISFRRLHDVDRSGAWILIAVIPVVGAIVLLVFYCTDSKPGENKYGVSPKYQGRDGVEEIQSM